MRILQFVLHRFTRTIKGENKMNVDTLEKQWKEYFWREYDKRVKKMNQEINSGWLVAIGLALMAITVLAYLVWGIMSLLLTGLPGFIGAIVFIVGSIEVWVHESIAEEQLMREKEAWMQKMSE